MAFSKKQLAILAFPTTKYSALVCDGAIRSGKTSVMALAYVLWAMSEFDRQNFAICGKSVQSAVRNVILPLMGVRYLAQQGFRLKYTITTHCLSISRGRRSNYFYIFGGKDESSYMLIQGITLAGVMLDEVALMPRSFVEQALARCSVPGSRHWFNCNPEGPKHWFYEEWVKDEKRQKNRLHLHFLLDDNPALAPEIKARYENMYTGVFRERYILGRWTKAEGLVYPFFNVEQHTVCDQGGPGRYFISIDYGTTNPCVFGLWRLHGGKAVMVKEYYYASRQEHTQKTDEEYYSALVDFAGRLPIEQVILDPSAASFKATIRQHGKFSVRDAKNAVLDGIRLTGTLIKEGRLLFDRGCENTIKEFGAYAWDEKKQQDAVIKENDHSMDQTRYFAYTIMRREVKAYGI